MLQLSPRQVHLDFHTSELIPDVAADFDAAAFAQTMQSASVSSVTVFARCHHGWLYYQDTRFPELVHPHLGGRNLLLEQVRALHDAGIRAPVYITVQWDYQSATTRPEWLVRKADGSHEGKPFNEPGFYQSLCVNTGYVDFLALITREVCTALGSELDGVFYDIVGIRPCWCAACRAEMKQLGIDTTDDLAVRAFTKQVLDRFKRRMTAVVREYSADCTIFYNAGHIGPCTKSSAETFSHFELESLPSGSWGYLHFPVTARYARKLGLDCLGMTGKFHTSWGDFHSLKNQAALEFECFRMLSYGFASSIGDQLEPNGRPNPATYRLIGQVYSRFAACEPWGRPSVPLVEAAVLTPEDDLHEHILPDSIMGAAQMLEELSLQFDIIDPDMDLTPYRLVILPDDFQASEAFQQKIDAYVAQGGSVIACAAGGLSAASQYPSSFGAEYASLTEKHPDFIVADGPLATGLEPDNEYVIYKQGVALRPAGASSLLTARAPFFNRAGDRFCSHFYTPSAKGAAYPAALEQGRVILFAHPLFTQYRQNAPAWCKRLVANAIDRLLPQRLIRHDGPSTLTTSLLGQPQANRVNIHLLTYIPVRKSATIDIIEERTVVRQVTLDLHLPQAIRSARLVPENIPLAVKDGQVTIPEIDGYAIVELTVGEA